MMTYNITCVCNKRKEKYVGVLLGVTRLGNSIKSKSGLYLSVVQKVTTEKMNALSPIVFLVALAVASASILAGPGLVVGPGAAIGARLGLGLAGPLGLGVGPLGLGVGPLGLGIGGIAAPAAVVGAGPLGVRVTATNLRVAPAGSPVGVLVPAGNGLEGQYVPDISEKLHDDGSYKPEIYGA
ncbi:hypothetical protein HHI36_001967 [Cryptolaemus montrouzieri]|uniref:Elastin n=1 Tax=Cryptolaemus montrouzieri TaxID=559131 RepID=A0ABD2P907_9CUCU